MARALGPSGKGDFYLLTLLPATIMVLLSLGLPQAFGFYAGRGETRGLTAKTFALAAGLAFPTLLVLAVVLNLLEGSFEEGLDPTALAIALCALPLALNATFTSGIVLGRQAVRWNAGVNIATTVLYASMLIIIVGILGYGVIGAVIAFFFATLFQTTGFVIASRRVSAIDQRPARPSYGALFRFGLPYYPGSLTGFFAARADIYMLTFLVANPSVSLGYYSMAVSMAELVFFLPNAVSTLFFPHVAGADRDDSDRQVPLVSRVTLLVTACAAIPLVPVAAIMIPILIPAFTPALPALYILLPGVVALSVDKVLTGYVAGLGMTGTTSIVNMGAFVLNIVANLLLIPRFGILGASAASLISYTAASIAFSVIASRLARVSILDFWIPRASDVRFTVSMSVALVDRIRGADRRTG